MEALTAECFLAAKRAGVEEAVMASLTASHPQMNWPKQSAYNFERMMVHGVRRAAEMREVVKMLDDLGLPSGLTSGVVDWQQSIGDLQAGDETALKAMDHQEIVSTIIDGLDFGNRAD